MVAPGLLSGGKGRELCFLICVNNDSKKTIDDDSRDENAEDDGDNENDEKNGHLNDTFLAITARATTKRFGRRQRR